MMKKTEKRLLYCDLFNNYIQHSQQRRYHRLAALTKFTEPRHYQQCRKK